MVVLQKVNPERADELTEVELYVAEYDDNGRLIGLTCATKSVIESGTVKITTAIPEANNYKLVLWDGNYVPLMGAIDDAESIQEK